jgi:hypothetical protein
MSQEQTFHIGDLVTVEERGGELIWDGTIYRFGHSDHFLVTCSDTSFTDIYPNYFHTDDHRLSTRCGKYVHKMYLKIRLDELPYDPTQQPDEDDDV